MAHVQESYTVLLQISLNTSKPEKQEHCANVVNTDRDFHSDSTELFLDCCVDVG